MIIMVAGPWSRSEKAVIRKNAGKIGAKEISALLPGRSMWGVTHAARKMGVSLKRYGANHWNAKYTAAQRAQLVAMRKQGKRYPEMTKATGIHPRAIQYILLHHRGTI